jgi:Histidine kinase
MSEASRQETPGTALGVSTWASRIDAYWACQAAGWAATVFVNIALSAAYAPGALETLAIIYAWGALGGVALTHGWRGLLQRRRWLAGMGRTPWARLVACIVLLGIAQTFVVTLGFAALRPPGSFASWGWLPGAVLSWTFVMLVWTALYASISAVRRANRMFAESLRLEVHAKDTELRALQAQVNPHFFFNSLNSVRGLIYENPESAAQMIDQLAGMMRYALQTGGEATVTLAREMEAVGAYLAIEKIRFEERLRVTLDVDPALAGLRIPPMVVQTLVENAVKHGVERNPAGSEVRVTARREGSGVVIEVANEGGLAPLGHSTGLGLQNARKRIALAGGVGARLDLAERDGWVVASLALPAFAHEAA